MLGRITFLILLLLIGAPKVFSRPPGSVFDNCPDKFARLAYRGLYDRAARKEFVASLNEKEIVDRFRAAEKMNDPHIEFLKKHGVRIKRGRLSANPGELAAGLDSEVTALVRSGRVARQDALRPVRLFVSDDGEEILVRRIHEAAPVGYREATDIGLDDENFWQLVERGDFPLSHPGLAAHYDESLSLINGFVHDSAHFSAFVAHPEYMAAIRNAARYINTLSGEEKEKTMVRVFLATELLAVMPRSKSHVFDQFARDFKFSDKNGKLIGTSLLKERISQTSDTDLFKIARALIDRIPPVEHLGGTARDPLVRLRRINGQMGSWSMFQDHSLTGELSTMLSVAEQTPADPARRAALIDSLSHAIRNWSELKDETPAKLVDDIVKGNKESPYYRAYCRNTVFPHETIAHHWCANN